MSISGRFAKIKDIIINDIDIEYCSGMKKVNNLNTITPDNACERLFILLFMKVLVFIDFVNQNFLPYSPARNSANPKLHNPGLVLKPTVVNRNLR